MSNLCSLAIGLTIISLQAPPAGAAPAWLGLMSLPVHGNASGGTAAAIAVKPAAEATAEPESPAVSKEELCETLVSAARARALPVTFVTNLIWQESRFDARAVSPAGAQGIAQFMPAVSKEVGLSNPFDPREAIPAATRLLRRLVDRFGNLGLAAAAYNGGPGRVQQWLARKGKLPSETRNYVAIITGQPADKWRGLKRAAAAFAVPSAVPCHGVATFAAANRSEQMQTAAAAPPKVRLAASTARGAQKRRVAAARTRATTSRRGAATRTAALVSRERSQKKS